MKTTWLRTLTSLAFVAVLAACGGGGGEEDLSGGTGGTGGTGGAGSGSPLSGDISTIAGTYSVVVSISDCDASDNDATTRFEAVSPGVCKVTSTATGATTVETRRDLLPVGRHTMTIAANGDVTVGTITRKCTDACIAAGAGGLTNYSIASGTGNAATASFNLSLILISTTSTPNSVVAGIIYGGAGQITGATVAVGETGVIVFGAN